MFFDFDSLEASEGVPPLLVEEGWTTVESEPTFELRCSGCKLPVRMLPELFEDCHRCGAPCCCYCVTKPDDSQWTTPALCKRCAVWQRLPKGEREGAREAAEVARRLCGLSLTEIRARALVVTDDDSTDVRAARALAEQLTLLARCPRHCGEAERELIWRFREELLEGPDAAHWLLLLVEEFLEPRARALVRVRLLTEEHLEALQQVLSSDLRVTRQMVASGAEGRDVLLCPGDQLNSDAGVLHDIGGTSGRDNLQYMVRRLPLDLEFRRDTVAMIARWAKSVPLSAQHALRALAALSRSGEWPGEVTVPIARSVAETLADSARFSNETLVAFSASIVVWLARAPADVVAPITKRLVNRAAKDETVLNSLYWAARQHEPSSPAIKGHAARRLGGFKEDLLRAAPSLEAQRLHDARTFFDELAEHDPGEVPLCVHGPFRCAPCFQNLVVDILDEPVKRFQSKTAPVCFGLRVQNPDGSEGVQHLIRKKEDDMLKQQQVSAIVAQMATSLLSDARMREHLTSLGLNPATFFAGHHHIQTIFPGVGIIEVVPHAHTLSKVRPVLDFLWRCRRSRDQPMQQLARAYGVSSAFWFAMSFLLGLGDRHGDNVMVTEDGTFFHIDFGFILGKDTMLFRHVAGPARVDFKEIKSVVGDDTPRAFFETLRLAFNVLRSGAHLLFEQLSLAAELDADGLLPLGQARARVRAFVEQRCQPGAGDLDAGDKIERIVRRCADAPTDWIRDATHGLAMRQPQVVIHGAVSKLAQHGACLASDATDVALEGLDAACSILDNFCGQRWERAALCSVCNRPVARRFVKWSRRERRHHCRLCRKTVCDRRECSATPNGKERRCRNCALSATAPEAVCVGPQAACTGELPLLGPGAPDLPEGANWPREPIILGLPAACSFTEEQHTLDFDTIQLTDEPPLGS